MASALVEKNFVVLRKTQGGLSHNCGSVALRRRESQPPEHLIRLSQRFPQLGALLQVCESWRPQGHAC